MESGLENKQSVPLTPPQMGRKSEWNMWQDSDGVRSARVSALNSVTGSLWPDVQPACWWVEEMRPGGNSQTTYI